MVRPATQRRRRAGTDPGPDTFLSNIDSKLISIMENNETRALREQIAKLVDEYAAIALAPPSFMPGKSAVPPSGKVLDAAELKLMVEASLDGWLTTGRFNDEFEKRLAAFI